MYNRVSGVISDILYSFDIGGEIDEPLKENEQLVKLGFTHEASDWLLNLGYSVEGIQSRLNDGYTAEEIVKAVTVKLLHDKVEIAAYQALQNGVIDLKLDKKFRVTHLTNEQSEKLLHEYIKNAAHKVMRTPDGYMNVRMNYLNEKQIRPVIKRAGDIIKDRDAKLTHATYSTFEELVTALDRHNAFVNKILFDAWGVPHRFGSDHLAEIKEKAGYTGPT